MFRTDTGSFNKLLTSLGLVLIAFAFVLPYLFFRNTDTLEIPAETIEGMTEVAQDAIRGRQQAISDIEPWVIGTSVASGFTGVALLFFGGRRLREAQAWEDRATQAQTKMAEAQFESASPEEVEAKRDEEAASALAEADRPSVSSQPTATSPAGPPLRRSQGAAEARASSQRPSYEVFRESVARIEDTVLAALQAAPLKTHSFSSEMRVSSARTGYPLHLDGFYKAQVEGYSDILLEIKATSRPASLLNVGRQWSDQLLARVIRYEQATGRRAIGWLVAAISAGSERDEALEARARKRLNELSMPKGIATVLAEEAIGQLPTYLDDVLALARGG